MPDDERDTSEPADEPADEPAPGRPQVDVTSALHEAGHEVELLGYEGIPDDGPVVVHEERSGPDDPLDFVNVQMPAD